MMVRNILSPFLTDFIVEIFLVFLHSNIKNLKILHALFFKYCTFLITQKKYICTNTTSSLFYNIVKDFLIPHNCQSIVFVNVYSRCQVNDKFEFILFLLVSNLLQFTSIVCNFTFSFNTEYYNQLSIDFSTLKNDLSQFLSHFYTLSMKL